MSQQTRDEQSMANILVFRNNCFISIGQSYELKLIDATTKHSTGDIPHTNDEIRLKAAELKMPFEQVQANVKVLQDNVSNTLMQGQALGLSEEQMQVIFLRVASCKLIPTAKDRNDVLRIIMGFIDSNGSKR